jgi:tRNA pseudouridine38-40 synthase
VPLLRRGEHAREAGLAGALTTSLYRIVLAYDGTDFEGWQVQAARRSGAAPSRTVQGELEAALTRLDGGAPVRVKGAGRTDAGVHALGQVASFELQRAIEPAALQRALNGLLSPEVRVREAAYAAAGFDARRSAVSKLYRYELDTSPVQLPTRRRHAGHVPFPLDRARVAEAAALYVGRHDFASLASSGGSAKTTVRTLTRSEAVWDGDTLVYEAEAEGFLRKMVRSLVGGLVAAGRGAVSVADLRRALDARDRRAWPAPADARGLTLVRVDYPAEPRVLT